MISFKLDILSVITTTALVFYKKNVVDLL